MEHECGGPLTCSHPFDEGTKSRLPVSAQQDQNSLCWQHEVVSSTIIICIKCIYIYICNVNIMCMYVYVICMCIIYIYTYM